MTLLFEAAPEPALPAWRKHEQDLDNPAVQLDYLTYLRLDICPWCCEDVGSVWCCQTRTPETSIDEKGNT